LVGEAVGGGVEESVGVWVGFDEDSAFAAGEEFGFFGVEGEVVEAGVFDEFVLPGEDGEFAAGVEGFEVVVLAGVGGGVGADGAGV
jgi:hypothetical protein